MDGKRMQVRIALVAGGVGLLWVLLVVALAPAAARALLVTISLVRVRVGWGGVYQSSLGSVAEQEGGYPGLGRSIGLFVVGGGVGSCHW